MMRIRITKPGIYGQDGEIPVGTELTVKQVPEAWAGRFEVIADTKGKKSVTNPAKSGGVEKSGD